MIRAFDANLRARFARHGSNDGMPASSQGFDALTDVATPIAAMAIRTFDLGNGVAAAHQQLARGSPLLVALSMVTMDNNEAWLAAGLALSVGAWLLRRLVTHVVSQSTNRSFGVSHSLGD